MNSTLWLSSFLWLEGEIPAELSDDAIPQLYDYILTDIQEYLNLNLHI